MQASKNRSLSFSNLRIGVKLIVGFVAILLVIIGLAIGISAKLEEARDGVNWTKHTYNVIGELDAIILAMVNQETGLRAFLLAGEDEFLEPYLGGIQEFGGAVSRVRELTMDNPRAQALINEVEEAGLGWRTGHAEVAISLMGNPATMTQAAQMEISGAGKTQMDALRVLVAEFVAMESALLTDRSQSLQSSLNNGQRFILLAVVVALLMTLVTAVVMLRNVDRPLREVAKTIKRLTAGDLNFEIANAERTDEVGQIALGLTEFQQVAKKEVSRVAAVEDAQRSQEQVVEIFSHAMDRMADLNLTCRIDSQDFPEDFLALRNSFNDLAQILTDAMIQLGSEAELVTSQATNLNESATGLAQRAENQAATLEESAAAIELLTKSIATSASIALDAETQTQENQSVAQKTSEIVHEAVKAMQRIEQTSSQITQITTVIDDIAFQTNLLALNAGVEAARAGEAGKGFAVVASEVRQLAQRSSESAQQIKGLITTSSQEVATGSALVSEAGTALEDILSRVVSVTERIKNISDANQEQSHGLREVNLGMQELDKVTQHNAGMAQKMLENSQDMAAVANNMLGVLRRFDTGSTGFESSRANSRVA